MSNRELIEKLRRNPRGVMFELEHECADALEKAEAELAAIKAAQSYPGGKGEQRRQLGEPSAISDETVCVPKAFGKSRFGVFLDNGEFEELPTVGWESHPKAHTARWVGGAQDMQTIKSAMLAAAQEGK